MAVPLEHDWIEPGQLGEPVEGKLSSDLDGARKLRSSLADGPLANSRLRQRSRES